MQEVTTIKVALSHFIFSGEPVNLVRALSSQLQVGERRLEDKNIPGFTLISRKETQDVYLALIGELAGTRVPTSIMGVTLVFIDVFIWSATHKTLFVVMSIVGGLASAAKILLMHVQKRRYGQRDVSVSEAERFEKLHFFVTSIIAASVGTVVAAAFSYGEPNIKSLATGLLFGYCSGVASRTAIRPTIATVALLLAAIPAITAATFATTVTDNMLALMFGIFLLGGIDTVRHVYKSSLRQLTNQLEMARLARNDPLTGLANRLGLREAYHAAARLHGGMAVHCFDLDGFKAVNDQYGHAAGDTILVSVAQRLRALAPLNTTIARVGGDEFVVLQAGLSNTIEAEHVAKDIIDSFSMPFATENGMIAIGASLGLSISFSNENLDELMRSADEASYFVKRKGGGVEIAADLQVRSANSRRFRIR